MPIPITAFDRSSRNPARAFTFLQPVALAAVLACGPLASMAQSAPTAPVVLNIAAQPLGAALNQLASQARLQLLVSPELVAGKTSPSVQGTLTPDAALRQLLAGTGLEANIQNGGVTVRRMSSTGTTLDEVKVVAAPDASALPKSFAGGQIARGGRNGFFGNRDLFEVPYSIVPFAREIIDNQQARTVVQVLRNDPSITINQNANSAGADDVFNIRGFIATSGAGTFDGMANLGGRSQALEGIERVELLKGPNAFLNGSPSLTVGGTINYVPKRAGAEPLTQVTALYSSNSIFGLHGDFGRRFGEDKRVGARVNLAQSDGATAVDNNYKRNKAATLAIDYQGDTVRLWGDFEYSTIYSRGFLGGTTINAGIAVPAAPSNRNNWGQPWGTYPQDKKRGLVRAEWDFAPNWTAGLAYGRFEQVDGPFPACRANITSSAGALALTCSTGGGLNYQNSTEATLKGRFETGAVSHKLALGVANTSTDSRSSPNNGAVVLPGNVGSNIYNPVYYAQPTFPVVTYPGKTNDTNISSIFVGDEMGFFRDRLLVTLGGRQVDFKVGNYNALTAATTSRFDKNVFTPAGGVVYKVQPGLSVYANYAEALEQSGTAPVGTANAGAVLEPLKTKQIEAGLKTEFGGLAATVAAFRIAKANTLTVNNVFGVDGEQVNSGLELALFGEATKGVRVLSGLTLLRAKQTKTTGGINDGKDAIGIARQQSRVGLEWDTPFVPGFTLSGGVSYSGSAFVDAENTRSIPAWNRLDLGARYSFKAGGYASVVRLNVENVGNKSYWASVDRGSLYLSQPRTVSLSLTTSF